LSLVKLGKKKGYELITTTLANAFFVEKEIFNFFGLTDNSVEVLRDTHTYETKIFQLYDGTICLQGYDQLVWHDVKINAKKIQVLPKPFRVFPRTSMGNVRYFFFKVYKHFNNLK
jgi:hypothetical protein